MSQPLRPPPTRRTTGRTGIVVVLSLALVATAAAVVVALLVNGGGSTESRSPTGPLQVPGDVHDPLPEAGGFAVGATGGERGHVYHVTSDADSASDPAPGTLRYGLQQTGPVWIVFDRDLTISLQAGLRVGSDVTIDGRDHRVELTGHGQPGLQIYGSRNVIVTNLILRDFGDVARTEENDPDDAIDINASTGVWIDHCTLSMAGDKLIAMEEGVRDITISWNHFYDQQQTVQIGAQYSGRADSHSTVTVHDNWFDHVGYRLPLVDYAHAHVFNNYMDQWSVSGVQAIRGAQVLLEANVFRVGASRKATIVKPPQRCNDKRTHCDGREGTVKLVGNLVIGRAILRRSESQDVFDPTYRYHAAPATTGLADRISRLAGAVEGPSQGR